ncbi:MAG TPA: hypothetical protein VKX96_12495 [Chloroflexota bacterium]|nr:hypothetical protein [Chloroflexota bacterium]
MRAADRFHRETRKLPEVGGGSRGGVEPVGVLAAPRFEDVDVASRLPRIRRRAGPLGSPVIPIPTRER